MDDWADEAALVERAKTDAQAFGLLYERYVDRIYRYVYYRTGSHPDAEDVTARVFMQAMRHLRRYVQRGAPLEAWLYRIAHNAVANWHRDRSRQRVVSLGRLAGMTMEEEGPFEQAAQSEQRRVLLAAVRRLPAERQELLILKFVEHLPNSEIGRIMGRSEGAIKSLYHRTLVALREELGGK